MSSKRLAFVHRVWQSTGWLSTLLLPLSWLYGLITGIRRLIFSRFSSLRYRCPLPVIIVGNIYVGGTGKTPVVMASVQALQEMGWTPGVVSRGYGIKIKGLPRMARGESDADWLGDEPTLITTTTGVPVAVHPRRPLAVRTMLQTYPDVDIIVADDGLQHLALERDIEIIVQDARGTGNGRLLPAGPLRESAKRLKTADLMVVHEPNGHPPSGALDTVSMYLQPYQVQHLRTGSIMPWQDWLGSASAGRIAAVAAIGHPERFFRMLENHGISVSCQHALPDHHALTPAQWLGIDADMILITAKDAVKCPEPVDERIWVVQVRPRFSRPDWMPALLERAGIRRKTHPTHWHYT